MVLSKNDVDPIRLPKTLQGFLHALKKTWRWSKGRWVYYEIENYAQVYSRYLRGSKSKLGEESSGILRSAPPLFSNSSILMFPLTPIR